VTTQGIGQHSVEGRTQVAQGRIHGRELQVLIAYGVPEAREGLGNVVLFGVTQQRHIPAGMAAYPLADELAEALLQDRPGLIALFDEGTAQDVSSVAIIKSFFPPMLL